LLQAAPGRCTAGKPVETAGGPNALAQTSDGAEVSPRFGRARQIERGAKRSCGSELRLARWPQIKARAAEIFPSIESAKRRLCLRSLKLCENGPETRRGFERLFQREVVGCSKCHQVNGQGRISVRTYLKLERS